MGFYNTNKRNQKYEIYIHLENMMQPLPLTYRTLVNNSKLVKSTGIYSYNSVDWPLSPLFYVQLCWATLGGMQLHPVRWDHPTS